MLRTLLSLTFGLSCSLFSPLSEGLAACEGDCDGDLEVSLTELRKAVEIGLGRELQASCEAVVEEGRVEVTQLIDAVRRRIDGCPGAPTRTFTSTRTRTATPTSTAAPPATATATPTATTTPTVAAGASPSVTAGPIDPCDNGSWTVTYQDAAGTNAVTTEVTLDGVGAVETRDTRTGRYTWILSGTECTEGVVFHRGVQVQMILQTTAIVPGTYALAPPFVNILYQEIQEPLVFIRSWSNDPGGTMTVDEVDGSGFRFHLSAPMKPSTIVSLNSTPTGTFTLKLSGHVERIAR